MVSGSLFYNYKSYFSMVLLALVDARYRFIWVDFGTNGRNCDAGIFNDSTLNQGLEEKALNVPGGMYRYLFSFIQQNCFILSCCY